MDKVTIIYPGRFEEPEVFEFPINSYSDINNLNINKQLDYIYRQCNHVDGTEWIAGKKLRSMSVGDIVVLNIDIETTRIYVCCGCGWEEIHLLVKEPKSWPEKK